MTAQPEALRLARELDDIHTTHVARNAAAELRRLHQFAEDQIGRATAAEAALQMTKATHALKIAAVEAQRDALLEALRPFAETDLTNPTVRDTFGFDVLFARAAIAAVEETK